MKEVLFIDTVCPKPYSGNTLREEGMGGSEATLVRIAEALALLGYNTRVMQHNREKFEIVNEVLYYNAVPDKADVVICFRSTIPIPALRAKYPTAKIYLWLQDLVNAEIGSKLQLLHDNRVEVICVSRFHVFQTIDAFRNFSQTPVKLDIKHIYNPVEDQIIPDNTRVDPNKLVFFSAPCKGLEHTLNVFKNFVNFPELSDMTLYLANPGYMPDLATAVPRVSNLGSLPHKEVIKHVREAFCVLHLNCVFPETFGIVYAEAQAVGTPFIGHDLGAIREISDHPSQLVNVRDPRAVIDRLISWKQGARPRVRLDSEFRLSNIIKQWHNLWKK